MKRLLAGCPPASPPGAKEAYHYLTYGWLAGGVAEVRLRRGKGYQGDNAEGTVPRGTGQGDSDKGGSAKGTVPSGTVQTGQS